jgi:phage terminase large subunit-like protein
VATSETDRFVAFFGMLGHRLEDFQRLIVEEVFSPRRETLVLIPRGCGKSTLLAAVALWSLLRGRGQQIVVGAASREQAGVLFDIARQMAQHPEIAPRVEVTRREIRTAGGWLKVIAADGPRQHGLILDLAIVDELHAHRTDELYLALRTSMLKRPGARMVTISTAGARTETPLGALRERALKLPKVERSGALTRAVGDNLAMLAWELPQGATINDMAAVKKCNPASWVTVDGLREQREAVHELAFARYHANVWTGGEAPWILADMWDGCAAAPVIEADHNVVVGVDASIRHDTTAVVVVRRDEREQFHALWRVWEPTRGQEVPLAEVESFVRDLAGHFRVLAVVHDPHYFWHARQRLEDEGIPMVEWQHRRMASATRTLHEVVAHERLRHGGDPVARQHALAAEVKEREFGLILSKTATKEPIDSLSALAMAVEWAASIEPPKKSVYEQRWLVVA